MLGIVSGLSDSWVIPGSVDGTIIKQRQIVLISSPSPRCKYTVQNIEWNPIASVSISYDDRLLERNMGIFAGKLKRNLVLEYSEYFTTVNNKIFFKPELTPPYGESFSQFSERIMSFYNDKLFNFQSDILICSHNQTLKMLTFVLRKLDFTLENWTSIRYPNGVITKL